MRDWIVFSAIPPGWTVPRLKRCVQRVALRAEADHSLRFVGLESVESETGRLTPGVSEDTNADALRFARGDVLFGKLRPYLAKAWLAEFEGRCSSEFLVLRAGRLIPEFLRYWVLSREFVDAVDRSTYGTKMPRAEWDFIGNLPVPVPPLHQQRAIAAFLDRETTRIDALIAKKERLLELLDEKRTALITRSVTKGLDPTVPMRKSAVEWLGEIPRHWKVKPLKFLLEEPLAYGVLKPDKYSGPDAVRLIRILDVRDGRVSLDDLEMISPGQSAEYLRTLVRRGDLVVSVVGTIGNSFVVPPELEGSNLSRALARVQPGKEVLVEFLEHVLAGTPFKTFVDLIPTGTAQKVLNLGDLGAFKFAAPPIPEQKAIVSRLSALCTQVSQLAVAVHKAIALLREYRTALISAAVTGQIDVSKMERTDAQEAQ